MTGLPYTDADVQLAYDAFVKAWTAHELVHPVPEVCPHARDVAEEDCCDEHGIRGALDALAAAGRLAPADDDPRHIIDISVDGWTIKHPLSCRPNLFDCPVNRLAEQGLGAVAGPVYAGRFECSVNDLGDRLLIGDRVDLEVRRDG
ncbi:hypothetical protein [Micromonospora sp. NPDC050200]|uniref:hypothetical protein n=1 Tax=Micromonospora sp. NPDC050200 TaxID=3155664 RepID=UPI0033D32D58